MSKFFLNLEKPDRGGHQWKSTEKFKSSLKKLSLWSVFVFGFLFFYLFQNSNLLFAQAALLDENQCDLQGVNYNLDSNTQTATVAGYNSKPSGAITIPETVSYRGKDYTVTNIKNRAFFFCSGLTSVTFPESLKSIGKGAFSGCSGLESVDFSQCTSLPSIGDSAFDNCTDACLIFSTDFNSTITTTAFDNVKRVTILGDDNTTISEHFTSYKKVTFKHLDSSDSTVVMVQYVKSNTTGNSIKNPSEYNDQFKKSYSSYWRLPDSSEQFVFGGDNSTVTNPTPVDNNLELIDAPFVQEYETAEIQFTKEFAGDYGKFVGAVKSALEKENEKLLLMRNLFSKLFSVSVNDIDLTQSTNLSNKLDGDGDGLMYYDITYYSINTQIQGNPGDSSIVFTIQVVKKVGSARTITITENPNVFSGVYNPTPESASVSVTVS